MFILKNNEKVQGGTFFLQSLTWRKPTPAAPAIVRDDKENILADLTADEPIRYFDPPLSVSGISLQCPSGDVVVAPLRLSAQMMTVLNLPGGVVVPGI